MIAFRPAFEPAFKSAFGAGSASRSLSSTVQAIFAAYGSSAGAMYDPSDLTSLYQDSTGMTPVTAVGQSVGLMLDKRYGLARSAELLVNGDFSQGATNWTPGTGWSITTKLIATAAATNTFTQSVSTVVAGKWYDVSITCDSLTSGGWKLLVEGGANIVGDQTTAGTFKGIVYAPVSGSVYVWSNSTLTASFTKVSVRELPGVHVYQPTGGARPVVQQDGSGNRYLAFDGTDDCLFTPGNVDFTASDEVTLATGLYKASDAAIGTVLELSATTASNNGTFGLYAPPTAASTAFSFTSKGTTAVSSAGVLASPASGVLTAQAKVATPVNLVRKNGVQSATSPSTQGTGNYGTFPIYMGRRGNASNAFNGRLYSLALIGKVVTAAQLSSIERWAAQKAGVTI